MEINKWNISGDKSKAVTVNNWGAKWKKEEEFFLLPLVQKQRFSDGRSGTFKSVSASAPFTPAAANDWRELLTV